MRPTARHAALIVSVASIAFFTNLGATHLWDEDEGFFAGAASEMLARHDWVVPHFNGQLFSHKPPFMYWMMMLGYETLGVTPLAARFGSAIFGIATALLTYFVGRRLFSAQVGLLAALILSSALMFDVVARAATPDSYLVFFMTFSLYLFTFGKRETVSQSRTSPVAGQSEERPCLPWKIAASMYAAMGMAVLVKGPIGVLLPMAAIGLYLLCTSRQESPPACACWHQRWLCKLRVFVQNFLRCLWAMRPITAASIVLLVAGPWFLSVGWITQGQFLAEFFGVHNFGRFLHPMESHHGSLLYYPVAILVGFFPWSVLAGATLIDLADRIRSRDAWSDAGVLLACWIVVIVTFFSLAGTKLPNYVLPAYPALALLTACVLHRWISQPQAVAKWQPRACFGILGLVGAALLIGLPLAGNLQLRGQPIVVVLGGTPALASELPWLGLLGIVPLVSAGASLWWSERGRELASVSAMTAGAVLLAVGILGFAAIRIDRYQYMERLAHRIIEASGGEHARVGQYRHMRPTLVFYLRRPVEAISDGRESSNFFASHENAFLVTTSQGLPDLRASLPADIVVLGEGAQFPKPGKVLLLGRVTRTSQRPASLTR